MSIKMTQTCEMCGRERDLPTTSARPSKPHPDSGGWRLLNVGAKEATLCSRCVSLVVEHALTRAEARRRDHAGTLNDRPLTLMFVECSG